MRETILGVTIKVQNIPDKFDMTQSGYMVVRRGADADLWYYGFYNNEDQARNTAIEIRNGVIVKL